MVSKKEPILFVINPASGSKRKASLKTIIHKNLNTSRFEPIIFKLNLQNSNNTEIDDFLRHGGRKVVAVGGDGTVNLVASKLIDTNAYLGIVPMGSGNGLARHLRIPLSPSKSIGLLNHERLTMIDYCLMNGTPYFCTAGVGFDAHVGYHFNQQKRRGFISYLGTTIREFPSYTPKKYRIHANGQTIDTEAFVITAANSSQYGNNAYIAPHADISDGQMDVTIISTFPASYAPIIGMKLFTNSIEESKYAQCFRTSEFTIESLSENLAHYDGESRVINGNLTFQCKHLGLNVIT